MMSKGSGILLLIVSSLVGCRSYDPDTFDARLRSATFETYHDAIVTYYPDLDRVGLDSQTMREQWEMDIVEAGTATDYYHSMAKMLASLDDPHLVLTPNYELWSEMDGPLGYTDLTITHVDRNPTLWNRYRDSRERRGLEWYDDTNYNGWTVKLFNDVLPESHLVNKVANVGPHNSRFQVLLAPPDESSKEKLIWRKRALNLNATADDGGHIHFRHYGSPLWKQAPGQTRAFIREQSRTADISEVHSGKYLFAWRLDDRGGISWNTRKTLPRSDGVEQLEKELEIAAGILEGTSCTLIDLRFQPGGNGKGFRAMMNRLLPGSVDMEFEREKEWLFFKIRPVTEIEESPSIVSKPVVVLVNEWTASYGEWMTSLLKRECDAMIIGAPTRGSEYCIVRVKGPDGSRLQFGGFPYTRTDGIPAFQAIGIEPDVLVTTDLGEVAGSSLTEALLDTHDRQTQAAWELLDMLCGDAEP